MSFKTRSGQNEVRLEGLCFFQEFAKAAFLEEFAQAGKHL